MLKRILTGAALALATGLCLGAPAQAKVVSFSDVSGFSCDVGAAVNHGGMTFAMDWYRCYYGPADSADFPTPLTSEVMAVGYVDTFFSAQDGGVFDLHSLDLAFGPFDHDGLLSDTTTITGYLDGGGTVSTTLTVGYGFERYHLNWQGLTGVNVSGLSQRVEYLAFDNILYAEPTGSKGGIPEPAVWLTLLLGFGACGVMLRRARQLATAPID